MKATHSAPTAHPGFHLHLLILKKREMILSFQVFTGYLRGFFDKALSLLFEILSYIIILC